MNDVIAYFIGVSNIFQIIISMNKVNMPIYVIDYDFICEVALIYVQIDNELV